MRIVYFTEPSQRFESSGLSHSAQAVGHLRRCGHRVQVVRPWRAFAPHGDGDPEFPGDEMKVSWSGLADLRCRWLAEPPHLVHAAAAGMLSWSALRLARTVGIAATADLSIRLDGAGAGSAASASSGWMQPLLLSCLRRFHTAADTTFVPNRALADALAARGFRHLQVLGRGIDADRFSPQHRDDALRRSWGAGPDDRVLLHAGPLLPNRGVTLALAAFECLRLDEPRLRMVVVGDGALRARLEAAHPRVHFAGVRRGEALARCLASADVCLLPNPADANSRIARQAQASGLALVAFDTPTAGALVDHGRNGWLAAPGDEASFFAAARRALRDSAPQGALRQRARFAALRSDREMRLRDFEQSLRSVVEATARQRIRDAARV